MKNQGKKKMNEEMKSKGCVICYLLSCRCRRKKLKLHIYLIYNILHKMRERKKERSEL